jgi:ribosomal protein L34E
MPPDEHQTIGVRVRQWTQEQSVQCRKNRGARTKAESEREHRGYGKCGRCGETSGGVAKVVEQGTHLASHKKRPDVA